MGWPGTSFSCSASPGLVCRRRYAALSAGDRSDVSETDCSTSAKFEYETGGIACSARTVSSRSGLRRHSADAEGLALYPWTDLASCSRHCGHRTSW
jgi:hypothetical protein